MSEPPRHVHFVAIGGTGMGSLAGLLAARGIRVTGSDDKLYPPMSVLLEQWRIPVAAGFRPEHVLDARPDLVVIGNAVRPDNPEARAAIDAGLRYLSFPDALHELAIAGKHSVVVTGTHGKTTTTSLVAALLLAAGRDPSLLVGGHSLDFDGSFREGRGEHFVVEGDEYDTAFFDKTPKFLHYGARTLLVTSIEFDHADIYRDLEHVEQAFRALVAQMPRDGTVVAALAHPAVRDVVRGAACRAFGYGVDAASLDWCASNLEADARGTHFDVLRDAKLAARAFVPLFGSFNVENALGALAVVAALGVPLERAVEALATFRGVKRRQELRGEVHGVAVIDDFAHHPTAVRASIDSIRQRFPGRRVIAVLEPRTNTSRRAIFQQDYALALACADRAVVRSVDAGPIYSATGPVEERLSSEQLVADLGVHGVPAIACAGVDEIIERLVADCRAGDVILCMSNGSFDGIWQRLLDALRASTPSAEPQAAQP
ncbi:MAG TPA: Mur ligase family protein [Myxococcota bacterium]|nr:Mur ligase family protein [Myxococcota bacterium]